MKNKINKQKSTNTVKKTGTFIENNKKAILYMGLTCLGVAIAYKVYVASSSIFEDKDDIPKFITDINNKNTTITKEQSEQFAKSLYDACNIAFPMYGTDEDTILKVFKKIKTSDDFKMVYKAFGNRNYNGYNAPPTGIFRHLDNYEPHDLVYWLRNELSPRDGEVYTKVKEVITSVGWTF